VNRTRTGGLLIAMLCFFYQANSPGGEIKTIICNRSEGDFDKQHATIRLMDREGILYQASQVSEINIVSPFGEETVSIACSRSLDFKAEGAIYPERNFNRCLGGSFWGDTAVNELRLHYGVNTGFFATLKQTNYVQTNNREIRLNCSDK
jgi:hypothetical protein